jgi:hypothetical protein
MRPPSNTVQTTMKLFIPTLRTCFFMVTLSIVSVAQAQTYTTPIPGSVFPSAWEESSSNWVNGNVSGYIEGQVVPMAVEITSSASEFIQLDLCLEVIDGIQVGFVDFDPWNTDVLPPNLPGAVSNSGLSISGEFGVKNGTIDAVSGPSLGEGNCPALDYGVRLNIHRSNLAASTWIVYGGLISYPGALIPPGPFTVLPGFSASNIAGTFQSRLAFPNGFKTINYSSVAPDSQLELEKTVTTAGGTCPGAKSINVTPGDQVKFCFEVSNTALILQMRNVQLNDPTLQAGPIALTGLTASGRLNAGSSAFAEVLFTIGSTGLFNTATATAQSAPILGITYSATSSASVYTCGDTVITSGEQCDDGNTDNFDGCTNQCQCGRCGCGIADSDTDADGTPDCLDNCPADPAKLSPGICGCGIADVDTDGDTVADCNDACPNDPGKSASVGRCGCGVPETDVDGDGTPACLDQCDSDATKTAPGLCGCGVPDIDTDGDGTVDCTDLCPTDPAKIAVGQCGCGVADTDSDTDGVADCNDQCPADPNKTAVGLCGCGVLDVDTDGDSVLDCSEDCDTDPAKTVPGICGCGFSDADSDGDGTANCLDACPSDSTKDASAGVCGCGVPDVDGNGDGVVDASDCTDSCPLDPLKNAAGICGCGTSDADNDTDGTPDCNDSCAADPAKVLPGACGCGVADTDTDGDRVPDCSDSCPGDPSKQNPGICGCGVADTDTDTDGTPDCNDLCPTDGSKTNPLVCGCGVAETDGDGDAVPDCTDQCPNDPAKSTPGTCGCGVLDTPGCGATPTPTASASPTGSATASPTTSASPVTPADCDQQDVTSLLFALDGNAAEQKAILEEALDKLAKVGRGIPGTKTYVNIAKGKAAALYNASWTATWSIDRINLSCPDSASCTAVSHDSQLAIFAASADQFLALTKQAVTKLRKAKGKKKFGKKYLIQAQAALAAGVSIQDQVPTESDVCK